MKLTKCFIAGECLYNKRRRKDDGNPVRADYDKLKAERDELVRKLADSEKACHELWESATDRDMSLIKERDTAVKALGMAMDELKKWRDMTACSCGFVGMRKWVECDRHVELENVIGKIKSLGILPVSVEGGK